MITPADLEQLLRLIKTELLGREKRAEGRKEGETMATEDAGRRGPEARAGYSLTPVLEDNRWGVWQGPGAATWFETERVGPETVTRWERTDPLLHFYTGLLLQQHVLAAADVWSEFYQGNALLTQFGGREELPAGAQSLWVGVVADRLAGVRSVGTR